MDLNRRNFLLGSAAAAALAGCATNKMGVRPLKPGEKPEASFALCEGDEVVAAYAYCNLHGLWKA